MSTNLWAQNSFCYDKGSVIFYLEYSWAPYIEWSTDAGDIIWGQGTDQIEIQFDNSFGSFYAKVIEYDNKGCIDSNIINFEVVNCEPEFFVPNAFSPNNDGLNDFFQPVLYHFELKEYHMRIFNRWGDQIFYSNDIDKVWTGVSDKSNKPAQDGVYVYLIEATDSFGHRIKTSGRVTLIR